MDTWNRLTAVSRGAGGWEAGRKKVKRLNTAPPPTHNIDTDKNVVLARGKRGRGRWKWATGVGWGMWTERGFAWGHGCVMQCAEDVLLSCTLETCVVL